LNIRAGTKKNVEEKKIDFVFILKFLAHGLLGRISIHEVKRFSINSRILRKIKEKLKLVALISGESYSHPTSCPINVISSRWCVAKGQSFSGTLAWQTRMDYGGS